MQVFLFQCDPEAFKWGVKKHHHVTWNLLVLSIRYSNVGEAICTSIRPKKYKVHQENEYRPW